MHKVFIIIVTLFLLTSCNLFVKDSVQEPVARVGENYLYRSDLQKILNANITTEDSLIVVNNYIQKWAQEQILLERAKMNLTEQKQIQFEDLVKQYKADLYINAYKERIVAKSMDTSVSKEAIESFYEAHKNNFKLNENLLKIRYVSIGHDYPDLKMVRAAFKKYDEEGREFLQNSELKFRAYSFNDSVWVKSSSVVKTIPGITAENKEEYLKKPQFFELSDSLGVYLVTVNEVLNRTEIAPLEYVLPTVKKILLNKRKLDFIKNLEKDLLDEATREKEFEVFDNKKKNKK